MSSDVVQKLWACMAFIDSTQKFVYRRDDQEVEGVRCVNSHVVNQVKSFSYVVIVRVHARRLHQEMVRDRDSLLS